MSWTRDMPDYTLLPDQLSLAVFNNVHDAFKETEHLISVPAQLIKFIMYFYGAVTFAFCWSMRLIRISNLNPQGNLSPIWKQEFKQTMATEASC